MQGLGTAALLPISQSLVVHAFDKNKKQLATSIWATLVGVGLAIGPGIGGFIVTFFSWRFIFFLSIPFPLISALLCLKYVQESKNVEDRSKIDKIGLGLLFVSLTFFLWSIIEAPTQGFSSTILIVFGASIVGFISLIFFELKTKNPLLDFHLFMNRNFFACSVCNFSIIFVVWLSFFLIPLYLQAYLGLTPFEAGLIMICLSAFMAICSAITGKWNWGPKRFIILGLTLFIGAMTFQIFIPGTIELWQMIISCILLGSGWGLAFGPAIAEGISAFPLNMSATATGAQTTFQEIGGAIGLALGGTLFRFFETKHFYALISPNQINEQMRQKIHSLLSDPLQVKAYLQTMKSKVLLQDFLDSFLYGYKAAFLLLFVVSILCWFLVAFFLRPKRQP